MTDPDALEDGEDDIPDLPPELETERYAGEETVLTPEELDITESDHVAQLSENRYVVSSDPIYPSSDPASDPVQGDAAGERTGTAGTDSGSSETDPDPSETEAATTDDSAREPPTGGETRSDDPPPRQGSVDPDTARRRLVESLSGSDTRYGFEIVASFGEDVSTHRTASDDVVKNFEGLLWWYARHVTDEVPPDEALGVLLLETSIPITYPTENVGELLSKYDLEPEDSIRDLMSVIEAERRRE